MRIKDADAAQRGPALLPVLLALTLGTALGFGATRLRGGSAAAPDAVPAPVPGSARAGDARLPTLSLTIAPQDLGRLQAARDEALRRGVLEQRADGMVPVQVRLGEASTAGEARLKGDLADHIDSDKWSLRLELDAPIAGMRRFSVQHPKTRGFVTEWLCLETGRREGLLAPRTAYWNVEINGTGKGVYFVEEHFGKELLEAQGRRDGPIVRFTEETMWSAWRQHDWRGTGTMPLAAARAMSLVSAAVAGYGERRLQQVAELNERLHRSLMMLRDLQRAHTATLQTSPLLAAQALHEQQGRVLDDVFAADAVGRMLAVYALHGAWHGLGWHQMRCYHDPVRDRLEPVLFDTGANPLARPAELLISSSEAALFTGSDAAYEAAFEALGRMIEPAYLAELVRELRPRLAVPVAAMQAEGMWPDSLDLDTMFERWLPERAAALRRILAPAAAADFAATAAPVRTADGTDAWVLEVEAWSTTDAPVRLLGFRFGNGRELPAGDLLLGPCGADGGREPWLRPGGEVQLPRGGTRLCLRVPLDTRLVHLGFAKALRAALRQELEPDRAVDVEVAVRYRLLGVEGGREHPLVPRRLDGPITGRPRAPSHEECRRRHPFLEDEGDGVLAVPAGRHEVLGDLLLPERVALRLHPGAELRLQPGAVLSCERLLAEATAEQPVVLAPRDEARGWAGIMVIDGSEPSVLQHVEVRGTTALQRGAWQSPGGVTFYRSPVEIRACRILDSRCEDALNVVGAAMTMAGTTIAGATSDLFDGDFVTGTIEDCEFADSVGDGVDVSGSRLEVRRCRFRAVGDKALSVGEDTRLRAVDIAVESASIGVAAKDRSEVEIEGLRVGAVAHFGLAAYVKKAEYGPARITARAVELPADVRHLCQTGSTIDLDGAVLPSAPADVADLYRRGILGK